MSRNRGISSCACEVLTVLVRNVVAITILVAFCQTKVNYIDVVTVLFRASDQEVIWLNVAMDDPCLVTFFYAPYQLNRDHQYSFEI